MTEPEAEARPVKTSPNTEIKPTVLDIGPPESWKPVQTFRGHEHNMVPDESEKEFEAVHCTICGIGRLIRRTNEAGL